jgi:hypothetical protein
MKHPRISKQKKALQFINQWNEHRGQMDRSVFDVVLKTLYINSKSELDLEKDIFAASKLQIPKTESERIWNVLMSSGLVSAAVGFGKAGKVELTKQGYQLMAQFGGYKEYLESVENSQKPQTIIMPFSIDNDEEQEEKKQTPTGRKQ